MSVDMSAKAVTARLRQASELLVLCDALGASTRAQRVEKAIEKLRPGYGDMLRRLAE